MYYTERAFIHIHPCSSTYTHIDMHRRRGRERSWLRLFSKMLLEQGPQTPIAWTCPWPTTWYRLSVRLCQSTWHKHMMRVGIILDYYLKGLYPKCLSSLILVLWRVQTSRQQKHVVAVPHLIVDRNQWQKAQEGTRQGTTFKSYNQWPIFHQRLWSSHHFP